MKPPPLPRAALALALLVFPFAIASGPTGKPGTEPFDEGRLEKQILVPACEDPMGMDVLPDGRILFIERPGHIKLYKPDARKAVKLGTVPTAVFGEVGMLGVAADRNFARTGWVYLFFCPAEKKETLRLSRFTVTGDKLDLKSEKKLLEIPIDIEGAIHMGGGLAMDTKGNLYVGVGDNCPPIDEVPIDRRPGKKISDALRSAGNTNDLRGKVLRIHPEPDGTYTIPKDNLFPDGKGGRPETYAMGCRNPFRIQVDAKTGWLYFGDVGCNVDVKFGSPGFDEINQARTAGNYGWPLFNGPNIPFRDYDFATKQLGPLWDVKNPVNNSPNNTGAKKLPPPLPALIWYSTVPSREFPELGSGGRSAMPGPVYYYEPAVKSAVKLPAQFDRTLFFLEWMRNWVKTVKLDANGKIERIEPFMGKENFRKPIDMKVGPEGALYLIEYGDKWAENHDAQISRIIYRRGNRPPVAVIEATPRAGKHPLTVRLDGGRSFDKDPGDRLSYAFRLPGGTLTVQGATAEARIDKPGTYKVELTVTDSHGASSTATAEVRVGNAPPKVQIVEPVNGGFFDWNQPVEYRVAVTDEEDGGTADGRISPDRVTVQTRYELRRRSVANPAAVDEASLHPGEALMRKSDCFSCHAAGDQSKGPPYALVAQKYHKQVDAREKLAKKVLEGGAGVWGSYPMPPHPQHTLDQTRLMVDWILTLTANTTTPPMPGTEGGFMVMAPPEFAAGIGGIETGVYLVKATYTDRGAPGAGPLTGESIHVLHARRKKAAFSDTREGVAIVHEIEGEGETGMVGRFGPGDHLSFAEINLRGIDRMTWRVASAGNSGGIFTLRADSPTGPVLAQIDVPATPDHNEYTVPVKDPGGVHDLFVVAETKPGAKSKTLSLNWIEFHDSPSAEDARASARVAALGRAEARKALFKARPFVRNWTMDDLLPAMAQLGRGRSFERGKALFKEASCLSCHRMGKEGGNLGPDLAEVGQRMAKQPQPREALLREVLEPSKVIEEKYRTHIVVTQDGKQHVGLILAQNDKAIQMAINPSAPNEVVEISRGRIDEMLKSDVSMMPVGLVSTLQQDEILDLLAYVEAGGNPNAPAFQKKTTKILLIPTRIDHPYATHMYTHECGVLAKCLNQTPGIEAVVSPDFDWPKDANLLKDVKAIVYYSRPAGDIILDPVRKQQVLKLLKSGVGFTAVHWATDASPKNGPEYMDILGGYFHNSFGGLNTSKRMLVQVAPEHPVCHGWKPYVLREEYYLKLKFHPKMRPILKANVDGLDQVVAWTFERPDSNGGRSFGTTLGHFHDNFEIEAFRRAIANGILWTAHVEVPREGAPVALRSEDLKLPPKR